MVLADIQTPAQTATSSGACNQLDFRSYIHISYALVSVDVEYDPAKAASNLKKHGVSFDEAATALLDSVALAIEDPDAEGERRWVLIGMSNKARLLTVVYALRHQRIRLISARDSTKRETRTYAQRV
jgi:uncharacterized DUF497 family protein